MHTTAATLRDTDPAQALTPLTEGDQLVANLTREAERRCNSDEVNLLRSHNPFDDLQPTDPARTLVTWPPPLSAARLSTGSAYVPAHRTRTNTLAQPVTDQFASDSSPS